MKGKPAPEGREREIPAPKADPGVIEADDHVMGQAPRDDGHLKSPSQGVRPER